MPTSPESPQPIAAIDDLLASVGLQHGTRATRKALKPKTAGPAKRARKVTPGRPQLLRVPGWAKYPWLAHGFSTRTGGNSTTYSADRATGECNLGYTSSDPKTNVDANRKAFLRELDWNGSLTTLRQVHSGVIRIHASHPSTAPALGDAAITDKPGELLAIQTADCVPILVADTRQRIVAAFHAGWRGTAKRIVERGVGRMRAEFGSQPKDLIAAIGPAIGPCCYAVGDEVIADFSSQFAYAPELFHEVSDSDPIRLKYPLLFLTARAPGHSNLGPQIHLDLWEANRRQLLAAGVAARNIWTAKECTACNNGRYFSYRAEQGFAGRMFSVVGIRP